MAKLYLVNTVKETNELTKMSPNKSVSVAEANLIQGPLLQPKLPVTRGKQLQFN